MIEDRMPRDRRVVLAFSVLASGAFGCRAETAGFFIGWEVTEHGEQSSCSAVRATRVELNVVGVKYGETYDHAFDCLEQHNGSGDVPVDDTYTLTYRLVDEGGDTLASFAPPTEVAVEAGAETPWPRAAFAVTLPRASFRTRFGDGGENCEATSTGGAGATRQEVRITDAAAGQCLKGSLDGVKVAFGGDATAPTCRPYACQPATQTNTLVRLWSGTFLVEVIGYQGATGDLIECFRSLPTAFTLAGADIDLGSIAAPFIEGASRCVRP